MMAQEQLPNQPKTRTLSRLQTQAELDAAAKSANIDSKGASNNLDSVISQLPSQASQNQTSTNSVQSNRSQGQSDLTDQQIAASMTDDGVYQTGSPDFDQAYQDEAELNPLAYESYSWQASEYVHHYKGTLWYVGLVVVVMALLVVAYLFQLWLSIGVFIAMGIAVAVYAHKPPRVLNYELDANSITIEGKRYPFESFRSFGVISDESWHTIDLESTRRFMPRLTVLFSDEDFDGIVSHLEAHLPRTDRDPDLVERVTRFLRF